MGKYLDIARQFEAKQLKNESLSLPHQQSISLHRSRYHEAAEEMREGCFDIDACWLINSHPELWKRMKNLDEVLNRLEEQTADEALYRDALAQLKATVREARALYKTKQSQTVKIQQ